MNQSQTAPAKSPRPQSGKPVASAVGRIAFVQSCWHRDIVDRCRSSFTVEVTRLGIEQSRLDFFEVPGVFEIPLQAKLLARTGRYAAIVAAGLVVDGGIYRHDFVSSAVIDALMSVQLATDVPILSAVLTPHRFHEHEEHVRFFREHFIVKGKEVAEACAKTVENMLALQAMAS